MIELLVLTDDVLEKLKTQAHLVGEFPFINLQTVVKKDGKPCLPCNKKNQTTQGYLNASKAALANMSPAKQARFCQLVQAKNVRLSYRNKDKQLVKATLKLEP